MTLKEAIKKHEYLKENYISMILYYRKHDNENKLRKSYYRACAKEEGQLVEWLKELEKRRENER